MAMTNLEALKLVYTALGGSAEIPAGATNADVIAMIATQAAALYTAATTPELPSVTKTQEGKVLTVNSQGKWAAADVPTELPAVTSEDAGDVLTVSAQGAWEAAALPTT